MSQSHLCNDVVLLSELSRYDKECVKLYMYLLEELYFFPHVFKLGLICLSLSCTFMFCVDGRTATAVIGVKRNPKNNTEKNRKHKAVSHPLQLYTVSAGSPHTPTLPTASL